MSLCREDARFVTGKGEHGQAAYVGLMRVRSESIKIKFHFIGDSTGSNAHRHSISF